MLQRFDLRILGRFWKKNLFHTVASCTLWPEMSYELRKAVHVFGWWGWGGGVRRRTSLSGMDKILASLGTFLESQNLSEKLILWGRNWVHWTDNFLNEDWTYFWTFEITIFLLQLLAILVDMCGKAKWLPFKICNHHSTEQADVSGWYERINCHLYLKSHNLIIHFRNY